MRALDTNDWMILNNIIYKIYENDNVNQMREQVINQMKMILDFDSAIFYLAGGEGNNQLTSGIRYNCEEDGLVDYDVADYSDGLRGGGKCTIYRETDLVSTGKREDMDYYLKMYKPNNWYYSLQMVLGRNKKFLGLVTFYRNKGKENFKYDDILLLDMLKEHLALRLDTGRQQEELTSEKISITEAVEKYGLTKREHTILSLLLMGKDNDEITDELGISVNTLKKHILNIYRKLGIKNRVQMFKMIREKE